MSIACGDCKPRGRKSVGSPARALHFSLTLYLCIYHQVLRLFNVSEEQMTKLKAPPRSHTLFSNVYVLTAHACKCNSKNISRAGVICVIL